MANWFKRKLGYKDVDSALSKSTPLIDRTGESDDRYLILGAIIHNKNVTIRLMFMLLFLSVGGNVFYQSTSKIKTELVAVDSVGTKIVVGPTSKNQVDKKTLIHREIEDFIEYARGLSSDNLYQKRVLSYVGSRIIAGSQAAQVYKEFKTERPPFETNKQSTYDVTIKSAIPQGGNTYYVEWIERQRSLAGEVIGSQRWKAIVTYRLVPVEDKNTLETNPIGFYISELNWSQMR